jgi:RimJ/RimL family protein N-acetyltransferase
MITDHWPLFGLRLHTPRLELRVPDLADLAQLAEVAAAGVHDPGRQPFVVPWTDGTNWSLNFVTVHDGQIIGTQAVDARQFATLREVSTGSWLGRAHHGQGFGTEMRAAVLDLAFTGLGAQWAVTEAFADNAGSYGVSRKLGYADDGIARHVVRGEAVVGRRLRLDRAGWAAARTVGVRIEGLTPCLPMFGC